MKKPFIIDAHIHLGKGFDYFVSDTTLAAILDYMDHLGVELAVSTHHTVIFGSLENGLKESAAAFKASGGRIFWLGLFDPNKIDESIRHFERSRKKGGFLGIKILPVIHGVSADDRRYRVIWEYAREHSLPILTHSWSRSSYHPEQATSLPELFEKYIDEFQDVRLIFAHMGGRAEGHLEARRLARTFPNVYLDMSGDIFNYNLVEDVVDDIGDEKILYGSDITMIDGRNHLGWILLAKISRQSKLKILRENALKVYRIHEHERRGDSSR